MIKTRGYELTKREEVASYLERPEKYNILEQTGRCSKPPLTW